LSRKSEWCRIIKRKRKIRNREEGKCDGRKKLQRRKSGKGKKRCKDDGKGR
jgi:hypothetical protein